jgi:hypothetical protein
MVTGRVLLLALALPWLLACETADVQAPSPSPDQSSTPEPSPVASLAAAAPSPPTMRLAVLNGATPIQNGPGAYRYTVQIPQLEGAVLHAQTIDALIYATLKRDLDDFLATAQTAPTLTELTCMGGAVRLTPKLAVLRVDCATSAAGASHPTVVMHTFNCDLLTARVLRLQDLFGAGSGYLEVLSNAAHMQFPAEATADADRSVADSTAPVVDNFRAFLLNRGALVVLFPGIRVAPGATAQPEVTVPYESLQRYFAAGIADLITG